MTQFEADFLRKLLKNAKESEMFKSNPPVQGNFDNEMETSLSKAMDEIESEGGPKKSVPETLAEAHDRAIKNLSAQADDYQREARRLNALEAEARLGIKALEAANRVLRDETKATNWLGTLPRAEGLPTEGASPEGASS